MNPEISKKSEHYQRVERFMRLAKQDCPDEPCIPSPEVRLLRARLVLEEAFELMEALGVGIAMGMGNTIGDVQFSDFSFVVDEESSLALTLIIDGCIDVSVVNVGTLIACGVPDVPFLKLVDENNLDKFGPGHTIREDGKLIKPPGHKPPAIAELLSGIYPSKSVASMPLDGWEVAREIAGWMDGQIRERALSRIKQAETYYMGKKEVPNA